VHASIRQVVRVAPLLGALLVSACGSGGAGTDEGSPGSPGSTGTPGTPPSGSVTYGEVHGGGQYHLGPVTFDEDPKLDHMHNACAPEHGYLASLQATTGLGGEWLAGLSSQYAGAGATCDACIRIQAKNGRSIVLRVVTYGTEDAAGSVDVSPSAYAALNTGEWPRSMTWQFARCPDEGNLAYEFESGTHEWWFGVWIRNPRVPISKVELSTDGAHWATVTRASDGTIQQSLHGQFWLRMTAMDGQVITEKFASRPTGGGIVASSQQFE
jgi:hypothetical protein